MAGDLQGRVCVLTGATQGIGRAAAESLLTTGVELVLVSRDLTRLQTLASDLRLRAPEAKVGVVAGDLSRMLEVRRVGAEIRARHHKVDLLLNNAGAVFARREVTVEGLERTFALNHLAYFLLTQELLPVLREAPAARVVNVASDAHRPARLDLDDLQYERTPYSAFGAYGRTKLMNILFTREQARRVEGSPITVNAMHPGFVRSGFGQNNPGFFGGIIALGQVLFARTPKRGARTLVWLATSPEVAGVSGKYFVDEHEATPSAAARDDATAHRLWEESERLAGLRAAAA
jgi:NAD(P)-dependent dehydrogenase (short-subunit alcohol dehydrogenase family)